MTDSYKHPHSIRQMLSFIRRFIDDNGPLHHQLTGDVMTLEQMEKYKDDIEDNTSSEIKEIYLHYVRQYMKDYDFYESKQRHSKSKFRIVGKNDKFQLQRKRFFFWWTLTKPCPKHEAEWFMQNLLAKKETFLYDRHGNKL